MIWRSGTHSGSLPGAGHSSNNGSARCQDLTVVAARHDQAFLQAIRCETADRAPMIARSRANDAAALSRGAHAIATTRCGVDERQGTFPMRAHSLAGWA